MSIIGLDRLELLACIAVARSIAHTGALVGLLVTCQSFIPALDEDTSGSLGHYDIHVISHNYDIICDKELYHVI